MSKINIEHMFKFDEGEKLVVYLCSRGFKTVGIGCNLNANPHMNILHRELNVGDKITQDESTALFNYDLGNVRNAIQQRMYYFGDLPERYQTVLINMVFQMGITGILKFPSMLKAMRAGDNAQVIAEMKDSAWYHQTPNRANRLISVVNGIIPKEYL